MTSLPPSGDFVGQKVFNRTDGKLYDWTGTAWEASVSDASVGAGSITATEIADGAISTPKLAANAVVADKIAGNTITGNKIVANTITGGLLATSGIITNSAQINDAVITDAKIANAAITTAKIANAQITSAKIGDLEVDTIKIANNAVTTSVFVQQSNTVTLPKNTFVTVLSSSINGVSGADIYYQLYFEAYATSNRGDEVVFLDWQVLFNGSVVLSYTIDENVRTIRPTVSRPFVFTSGSGTQTFSVQLRVRNTGTSVGEGEALFRNQSLLMRLK